jgi:hypothetical protein
MENTLTQDAASERKRSADAVRSSPKPRLAKAPQKALGNRTLGRLLSAAGDRRVQRKCKGCAAGAKPCAACAARQSQPERIQSQLGAGAALEGSVRSRMESVFGQDFSGVRVHTGSTAAQLSDGLDARAFAVGRDVAFGAGEYRPGTIVGDALIAHELAHVVQQKDAAVKPMRFGRQDAAEGSLEREADRSAASAVKALWGRAAGSASALAANAMPRLRSGLAISRCGKGQRVDGNRYGYWNIDQGTSDGSGPNTQYASDTDIYFNPNKDTVNCSEISFIQAVQRNFAGGGTAETRPIPLGRQTASGWKVDRLIGKQLGWYGYNDGGRAGDLVEPGSSPDNTAHMHDVPNWSVGNTSWSFETCAVCKSGHDSNTAYGCLTWGFDADANSTLTKHVPAHHDRPSADFTAALGAWNAQAAGPAAQRNAPAQSPLPALH